jgi:hypothetical protein
MENGMTDHDYHAEYNSIRDWLIATNPQLDKGSARRMAKRIMSYEKRRDSERKA